MAVDSTFVDTDYNGQSLRNVGIVYFGDPSTDGSFRITINSGVLVIEQLVSGVWTNRGTFGE